jgi:hypothetical protein
MRHQARAAIASSSEWRERLMSTPLARTIFDSATAWMSFLGASAKAGLESAQTALAARLDSAHASVNASAGAVDAAPVQASHDSSASHYSPSAIARALVRFARFLRTDVNWIHTPLLLGTPLIAL